jgi:hypothetical protein
MTARYRVIHLRKTLIQALFKGRIWTDWYIAQHKRWWGWKELGSYRTHAEAEQACELHARGELGPGGGRIISEYEERER